MIFRPATRQRQVTREAADAAANRQEHVKLRREYLQTVQSLQELEAEVQQHKAEYWELNVGVLEALLKSVSGNLKDGSPAPHLEPAERAKEYADFLDKAWKTIRIIRDNGVTGEKIDQAEFRLENLKSHVSAMKLEADVNEGRRVAPLPALKPQPVARKDAPSDPFKTIGTGVTILDPRADDSDRIITITPASTGDDLLREFLATHPLLLKQILLRDLPPESGENPIEVSDEKARSKAQIPPGWVPCQCPGAHEGLGIWVEGTMYHDPSYHCP